MKAKPKREWFANDDFWRDFYPYMFPERKYEEAEKDAAALLRLVKPRGKAVLDLCCGPGRFSTALAKRRYAVTGVDRSPFLLGKAKARGRKLGVKVEWIREDMREFQQPGAFDLAISMFTSFGYFEDESDDRMVLAHVLESLRPGGAFVIDTIGKEWLAAVFDPGHVEVMPDGSRLAMLREAVAGWTRMWNEWTLIRKGRAKTYVVEHTLYTGKELRTLLEQAGFVDVKAYGGLGGEPYDRKAKRLVVVGRKRAG